jgi:protein TonB
VAIKSDGSIHEIHLKRSSGHKVLDEAAINIVKLPRHTRRFHRTLPRYRYYRYQPHWRFTNSDRLQTE